VFELAREMTDHDPEAKRDFFARMKALAVETGVPITFGNSWWHHHKPELWRGYFDLVDETVAEGGKVLVQAGGSMSGSMRSFETVLPYDKAPVWAEFRKLPLAEQEKGLRDPAMRKKLVDAANGYKLVKAATDGNQIRDVEWDWLFPLFTPMPPYKSIAQIAKEQNKAPIDVMIDLALEKNLKLFFGNPSFNGDDDVVLAMIRHPNAAVTFSDAGAHVASNLNPTHTHLLAEWVREKQAITMEAAVRKLTLDLASFWGLKGRGLLRKGFMADIVVFDPETIEPGMPSLVHDLPTGCPRLVQKAVGIKNTVVNGTILLKDGAHTGAYPGRLMRA
jgi:N-acyl-D-amino-acid deacylase